MDIDRCNSIFELFAAFNFTYAVISHPDNYNSAVTTEGTAGKGKSFSEQIDGYLIKPYSKIKDTGKEIDNEMSTRSHALET